MELKRWHVFFATFIVFLIAFYALNTKYDRFARIEGIDNDRRALILNYLSKEEQEYLVMQAIPMDRFEKYMQDDNFYLPYYEFYLKYDEIHDIEDISTIVFKANYVAIRLNMINEGEAYQYFLELIRYDLLNDFEMNENFNYRYLPYYLVCKEVYADARYIEDVEEIVNSFASLGIESSRDIVRYLTEGLNTYSSESFKFLLLGSPFYENASLLYSFDNTVVLNETNYIGSYTPKNLVLLNDLKRLYYHMYLTEEAYLALLELESALVEETGNEKLTVLKAYQSYVSLSQNGGIPGHDEFQLGTSISLKQDGVDPNQLADTEIGLWLKENAHRFGYILRYPSDKQEITGHDGVAHLYRYVGKETATYMYENNLCLEEVNE